MLTFADEQPLNRSLLSLTERLASDSEIKHFKKGGNRDKTAASQFVPSITLTPTL